MRRYLRSCRRRTWQKRQKGGFLKKYDFAYAGRDTINQAFKNLKKSAPPLINNLSAELNKILEQQINQIIKQGGLNFEKLVWNYLGE